jgi:hypothetical protein
MIKRIMEKIIKKMLMLKLIRKKLSQLIGEKRKKMKLLKIYLKMIILTITIL